VFGQRLGCMDPNVSATAATVRQRRELTFKHNVTVGRHGWLRLTPAYSVKLVEDMLRDEVAELAVFDPFSGTGTTPLVAVNQGYDAIATDINPFLVWLARAKAAKYSPAQLRSARSALDEALRLVQRGEAEPTAAPPIHDIERWWTAQRLELLCRLQAAVAATTRRKQAARTLLQLAFCRTMIELSNAAFNHQSMSFRQPKGAQVEMFFVCDDAPSLARFESNALEILATAADNPRGQATIVSGDSRTLQPIQPGSFDMLVTSPPYPNRMSYIRELRPYMYWLGFLKDAREAGELDWEAIGGTWGVATSRLGDWRAPEPSVFPAELEQAISAVRSSGARNGALLATYIAKYFHDMRSHFSAVSERIRPGGRVHYIVGNSTFYSVLISTEQVYAEMLRALGFVDVQIQLLRKRNSKRELYEYDVSATRGV
jgi:hypothetical protein